MSEGVAIAGLVLAAVGTGTGVYYQKKGEKEKKEADKAAAAAAELANQRTIRQSIAASRLQQAQVLASGQAATGGTDSSGIQGGIGAAQTQLASNIGFANTTMAANSAINSATQKYNQYMSNAGLATTIGNLPSQFGFDPKTAASKIAENIHNKTFAQNFWKW